LVATQLSQCAAQAVPLPTTKRLDLFGSLSAG
jgi:hypothetical protein